MNKLASIILSAAIAAGLAGCAPLPSDGGEPVASAEQAATPTAGKVLQVAAADILGGGVGAKAGGIFGPWGAAIGAVIVGGAASYAEASSRVIGNGPGVGTDPGNAANPLDNVGAEHNQALESTALYVKDGGCIPWPRRWPWERWPRDPMRDWGRDFGYAPEIVQSQEIEDALAKGLTLANRPADAQTRIDDIVAAGLLSPGAGATLSAYFASVDGLATADEVILATKDFEAQLLAAPLPDDEQQSVLASLSIARYSVYYWAKQAADPGSPWRVCGAGDSAPTATP